MIRYLIISNDTILYHIIEHCIIWYDTLMYYMNWYDIIQLLYIIWLYYIVQYRKKWWNIISYDTISNYIIRYYIRCAISHNAIWHFMIRYDTIFDNI